VVFFFGYIFKNFSSQTFLASAIFEIILVIRQSPS